MKKTISIIIPCYNVEKYIGRCIDSLIHQTMNIELLELIFINDASTDHTLDILLDFEKKYSDSIIVINNKVNLRQGGARNIGLQYASGDYIGFVDSDDWVEYDMYEKLYNKAIEYNCDIVYCQHIRDDGSEKTKNNNKTKFNKKTGKEDILIKIENDSERSEFIASNIIGVDVWNKLYKKEIIINNNIVFPEKLAYEDLFWGSMFYLYIDTVYILEERLYHYFVNPKSTVLYKNEEYHFDMLTINYLKWEEYQRRGVIDKYRQALEYDFITTYYFTVIKMLFLRFDEVPYDKFIELQSNMINLVPNYKQNQYIIKHTSQYYQILLELIDKSISKEELELVAVNFREISRINK